MIFLQETKYPYFQELFQKKISIPTNLSRNNKTYKYKKLKKAMKFIPNSVIELFYNNPKQFFNESDKLLQNTNYLDDTGNSIFDLYFAMYFDKTNNNKIYKDNFRNFFTQNKKLVIDFSINTFLHKLFANPNKNKFFTIFTKLNEILFLNENLLMKSNYINESCISLMLTYTKEKSQKLIHKNNIIQFNEIKNFWNIIYAKFNSIIHKLSSDDIQLIKDILFGDFSDVKNLKFNEIYDTLLRNIKGKQDEEINNIIFSPNIDFNYLNYLYKHSTKKEEYEKLFQFFLNYQHKFENIMLNHLYYILNYANFSYLKSNKEKKIAEKEYCIKVINESIKNLFQNKIQKKCIFQYKEPKSTRVSFGRNTDLKKGKNLIQRLEFNIIQLILMNKYLNLESKCDLIGFIFDNINEELHLNYYNCNKFEFSFILPYLKIIKNKQYSIEKKLLNDISLENEEYLDHNKSYILKNYLNNVSESINKVDFINTNYLNFLFFPKKYFREILWYYQPSFDSILPIYRWPNFEKNELKYVKNFYLKPIMIILGNYIKETNNKALTKKIIDYKDLSIYDSINNSLVTFVSQIHNYSNRIFCDLQSIMQSIINFYDEYLELIQKIIRGVIDECIKTHEYIHEMENNLCGEESETKWDKKGILKKTHLLLQKLCNCKENEINKTKILEFIKGSLKKYYDSHNYYCQDNNEIKDYLKDNKYDISYYEILFYLLSKTNSIMYIEEINWYEKNISFNLDSPEIITNILKKNIFLLLNVSFTEKPKDYLINIFDNFLYLLLPNNKKLFGPYKKILLNYNENINNYNNKKKIHLLLFKLHILVNFYYIINNFPEYNYIYYFLCIFAFYAQTFDEANKEYIIYTVDYFQELIKIKNLNKSEYEEKLLYLGLTKNRLFFEKIIVISFFNSFCKTYSRDFYYYRHFDEDSKKNFKYYHYIYDYKLLINFLIENCSKFNFRNNNNCFIYKFLYLFLIKKHILFISYAQYKILNCLYLLKLNVEDIINNETKEYKINDWFLFLQGPNKIITENQMEEYITQLQKVINKIKQSYYLENKIIPNNNIFKNILLFLKICDKKKINHSFFDKFYPTKTFFSYLISFFESNKNYIQSIQLINIILEFKNLDGFKNNIIYILKFHNEIKDKKIVKSLLAQIDNDIYHSIFKKYYSLILSFNDIQLFYKFNPFTNENYIKHENILKYCINNNLVDIYNLYSPYVFNIYKDFKKKKKLINSLLNSIFYNNNYDSFISKITQENKKLLTNEINPDSKDFYFLNITTSKKKFESLKKNFIISNNININNYFIVENCIFRNMNLKLALQYIKLLSQDEKVKLLKTKYPNLNGSIINILLPINAYEILLELVPLIKKFPNEFNEILYPINEKDNTKDSNKLSINESKFILFHNEVSSISNILIHPLNYCMNYNCYESFAILYDFYSKDIFNTSYFNKCWVIKFFEFFKNSKNKENIKKLNLNFYQFSLDFEKIFNYIKEINNNNNKLSQFYNIDEENIFYIYFQIFILKQIPIELSLLFQNKHIKNEILYLIIFAFYEIKGETLLPIRKYYPNFYNKITIYYNKIKNLTLKLPHEEFKEENVSKKLFNNPLNLFIEFFSKFNFSKIAFIIIQEYNLINDFEKIGNDRVIFYIYDTCNCLFYWVYEFFHNYKSLKKKEFSNILKRIMKISEKYNELEVKIQNDKSSNSNYSYFSRQTKKIPFIFEEFYLNKSEYIFCQYLSNFYEISKKKIQRLNGDFSQYKDDLKLIISNCNYIIQNKQFDNYKELFGTDDIYLNIFNELKSNFKTREISMLLINEMEKKVKNSYINILKMFFNKYFSSNIIQTQLNKKSESYIIFFNLYQTLCNIMILIIEKYEILISLNWKSECKLIERKNNDEAKIILQNSIQNFLISKLENENFNIKIPYYFDEEILDFVETNSKIELLNYYKVIFNDSIFNDLIQYPRVFYSFFKNEDFDFQSKFALDDINYFYFQIKKKKNAFFPFIYSLISNWKFNPIDSIKVFDGHLGNNNLELYFNILCLNFEKDFYNIKNRVELHKIKDNDKRNEEKQKLVQKVYEKDFIFEKTKEISNSFVLNLFPSIYTLLILYSTYCSIPSNNIELKNVHLFNHIIEEILKIMNKNFYYLDKYILYKVFNPYFTEPYISLDSSIIISEFHQKFLPQFTFISNNYKQFTPNFDKFDNQIKILFSFNFSKITDSIFETKFMNNTNVNSLIQIRANYYIFSHSILKETIDNFIQNILYLLAHNGITSINNFTIIIDTIIKRSLEGKEKEQLIQIFNNLNKQNNIINIFDLLLNIKEIRFNKNHNIITISLYYNNFEIPENLNEKDILFMINQQKNILIPLLGWSNWYSYEFINKIIISQLLKK